VLLISAYVIVYIHRCITDQGTVMPRHYIYNCYFRRVIIFKMYPEED